MHLVSLCNKICQKLQIHGSGDLVIWCIFSNSQHIFSNFDNNIWVNICIDAKILKKCHCRIPFSCGTKIGPIKLKKNYEVVWDMNVQLFWHFLFFFHFCIDLPNALQVYFSQQSKFGVSPDSYTIKYISPSRLHPALLHPLEGFLTCAFT